MDQKMAKRGLFFVKILSLKASEVFYLKLFWGLFLLILQPKINLLFIANGFYLLDMFIAVSFFADVYATSNAGTHTAKENKYQDYSHGIATFILQLSLVLYDQIGFFFFHDNETTLLLLKLLFSLLILPTAIIIIWAGFFRIFIVIS